MPRAWLLNLDAELELAAPQDYAASSRMRARVLADARALGERIRALPGHRDDTIVEADRALPPDREWLGVAWCPTPSAVARLAAAGARVGDTPPLHVLQRVNHRSFCEPMRTADLPAARFVIDLAILDAVLAGPDLGHGFLLKRPFAFSGRWRKRVPRGVLAGAARTWAEASMRDYGRGLMVEPWVVIVAEFALHGLVGRDGSARLGRPVVLETDSAGAWLRNRACAPGELEHVEHERLVAVGSEVARELHAAGYFGPFGIDAFRWRDARGATHFRALSDLNARFTMGWWIGMA